MGFKEECEGHEEDVVSNSKDWSPDTALMQLLLDEKLSEAVEKDLWDKYNKGELTMNQVREQLNMPLPKTSWIDTSGLEVHKDICQLLGAIYEAKNADYGDSFKHSLDKRGLVAATVRMEDKLNRIDNLCKDDATSKVTNEKLEDTVLDLANYAIMTAMWLRYQPVKD